MCFSLKKNARVFEIFLFYKDNKSLYKSIIMFLSSSPGGAQIGRLAIIDFGHVEGTSRPRVDDVSLGSNVISKSVLLVFTQSSKVLLVNVERVSWFICVLLLFKCKLFLSNFYPHSALFYSMYNISLCTNLGHNISLILKLRTQ